MTGKCSIPVGRLTQLSLLGETCLDCGAPSAVNVLETATFLDDGWTQPGISEEWWCAACGSSVLTVRPQASNWIERVWG